MSHSLSQGERKVARMGQAPVGRLLLEFSIPAILGMIVNGAYQLIDSIFLGQAIGEVGLSTLTVAGPAMTFVLALALLVGSGGNALCALKLGEGKKDQAERVLGNTTTLGILISFVVLLVTFSPAIELLLSISSATPEVRPSARLFMQIISCGFVFQILGMSLNNFIRTCGAPNRALLTMVVGALFCIVFNFAFVLLLGWGIAGSALATIIGEAIACVSVVWYFTITPQVPLRLRLRCLIPDLHLMGRIAVLGTASFVVQASFALIAFVTNYLLVKWGASSPIGPDRALASIGIAQRVGFFTVLPMIGIAVAMQPILGYNYGAGLYHRVKHTLMLSIRAGIVIGAIMFAIIHLWPHEIVEAFGITDADLKGFTAHALEIYLLSLPLIGFQIVCTNYFQAIGQPLKSIFLALTRQVLFQIPLLIAMPYILPRLFAGMDPLNAIYLAPPLSDGLAIFTTGIVVLFEARRMKRLEKSQSHEAV